MGAQDFLAGAAGGARLGKQVLVKRAGGAAAFGGQLRGVGGEETAVELFQLEAVLLEEGGRRVARAVADAAVVTPDKTFDAVFRFFSFCLPSSVLSLRVFAVADVIVPASPVVAPTIDDIIEPFALLSILDTSTYLYSLHASTILCASVISSPFIRACIIDCCSESTADIHVFICSLNPTLTLLVPAIAAPAIFVTVLPANKPVRQLPSFLDCSVSLSISDW